MASAADDEATRPELPSAEAAPSAAAPSRAGSERWSERPAVELERLLEEQPAHPEREAVAAALAAKWKEHYLRVARAAAETPGTAAPSPVPAASAAGGGWRTWLRERFSALRKRLAAMLAPATEPPAAPPGGTS